MQQTKLSKLVSIARKNISKNHGEGFEKAVCYIVENHFIRVHDRELIRLY